MRCANSVVVASKRFCVNVLSTNICRRVLSDRNAQIDSTHLMRDFVPNQLETCGMQAKRLQDFFASAGFYCLCVGVAVAASAGIALVVWCGRQRRAGASKAANGSRTVSRSSANASDKEHAQTTQ